MKKPYQFIPIKECGESLVPIPATVFSLVKPHPYMVLGADYGGRSPYFVRETVLLRLMQAQQELQTVEPSYRLQIFDAYRPITVQRFMVDYTFGQLKGQRELNPLEMQTVWEEVYRFWALPSEDPTMPPPHSTGAAVDVTLVDAAGQPLPMGGEIDEIGDRSHPNFYEYSPSPIEQRYHKNRLLLSTVMTQAGFLQHPNEWWHFSYGDQLWAWQKQQTYPQLDLPLAIARYGRI